MTVDKALEIADIYGLHKEIQQELDKGSTPEQALEEWDCALSVREAKEDWLKD